MFLKCQFILRSQTRFQTGHDHNSEKVFKVWNHTFVIEGNDVDSFLRQEDFPEFFLLASSNHMYYV